MKKPWSILAAMIESRGVAAMVTVAELDGSGPREIGARMLVARDGQTSGTVGGGRLEWQALAQAQRMMTEGQKAPVGKYYALGPELGQCCGGAVTLYFEVFDEDDLEFIRKASRLEAEYRDFAVETRPRADGAERSISVTPQSSAARFEQYSDGRVKACFAIDMTPIWLFGAGHVGRALVNALAPLPFHVTWLDSRPGQFRDFSSPDVICMADQDPVSALDCCPSEAFVVIMTHSHELDLELCEKTLHEDRFGFVGVIGSRTKAARFRLRLKNTGLNEDAIARLVSPLGVDTIKGKEPAIVATSIVCQLLERREIRRRKSNGQQFQELDEGESVHA